MASFSVANTYFTRHHLWSLLAAVVLFFLYSVYPIMSGALSAGPIRFNSPDEVANYVFAKRVAIGHLPVMSDIEATAFNNLAHPRSTRVVGHHIVPVSFLGLPVMYGLIGGLFGVGTLPLITALIAALAVIAFYDTLKRWCFKRAAFISTVVLALHPAWWYYAERGFYHNVLFVSLLIFAAWFYTKALKRGVTAPEEGIRQPARSKLSEDGDPFLAKFNNYFWGACVCIALALFVRTIEALWVLPLCIWILWHERARVTRKHMFILLGIAAAAILSWTFFQLQLYGNVGSSGYLATLPAGQGTSWIIDSLKTVKRILLPFGFDFSTLTANVWRFGIFLFTPWWILTLLGVWHERASKMWQSYAIVTFLITLWLFFFYGSLPIVDTVGSHPLSLGNSLARYWLPVAVLWTPFVGLALERLSRRLWAFGTIIFLLILVSFHLVWWEPVEGLVSVAERVQSYTQAAKMAVSQIPANSVIIGDRADKVFFPERRVIVSNGRPVLSIPEVQMWLATNNFNGAIYYSAPRPIDGQSRSILSGSEKYQIGEPTILADNSYLYELSRTR